MTRSMKLGMCALSLCALSTGLFAQTPSTQPSSSTAGDKITITGCVERAPGSPSSTTGTTGTSGAATTPSADTKFLLTKASAGSSSGSGATGTSGSTSATPSSSASASATSYRLDADDSQLTSHVGHKVEISGTIQDRGAASSSASSSGTSASSSATTTAPKVKVESVRMIAASCS